MSTLAILISLGLLMFLAYRGWSVILIAPLLALLAVLFSGDVALMLPTYTQVFMKGVGGYVTTYFPLFLLGAVFGKLMDDSGAARAIAHGIVAKVDQLQVGDYVTAGRPVFTQANPRIWVEANFKENQLQYMRLGQPATIKIDAFPDLKLTAHLTSFSPGTGNAFSVLPAENATGNWVKVVQRLPVELTIDKLPASIPLHAGLSVEVTVDTGHQRHLFSHDTPPTQPEAAQAQ